MSKLKKNLTEIIKFWIYWIIVVTLTIGLFFALLENANFEGKDMEFYLAHKDNLRYNFRLFAITSFILTYILSNPLINHFYQNKTINSGKRFLWQTIFYFLILVSMIAFFIVFCA